MPQATDLSGATVEGRYRLLSLLGAGGFGAVYQARDARLGRIVAIKVVHPWWDRDPEWSARFEQEARLAASIGHPGIVAVHDCGRDPELGLFIVYELVDGESLAASTARQQMRPAAAGEVCASVLDALAAAHRRGIVHRDIGPQNILLGSDGSVKLTDFGVAYLSTGMTGSSASATIVGRPSYMSPEQATGRRVGPASDLYSLGVVLYELLSGHPPFTGENHVAIATQHTLEPVPPLPDSVPAALESITRAALQKQPSDRFRSADAMARALRDAVRAEAETTTHAGTRDAGPVAFDAHDETTAVLKTRPRKRRLGLIALALLGVVAAGAVAVATLNLNKQPAALAARENIAATPPKTIPRSKRPKRPKRAPALVHVPSFAGLTEASADSLAHRYKLGLGVGRQPSSQTPSGNVISQSPLVGARVGRGTVVTLEVSTGPPPVAVPALTNQPLANAEAELRSSSLTWTVNFTNGQGDSPGTVMSQTPAPGTSVAPGSPVGLDVARSLSWHTVADIELNSAGASDRFTITGHKWRLRYVLTFPPCPYGICPSLLLSVTGDGFDSYQLSAGTHQTEVPEPPGTYAINVFGTGKFTLNVVVEEYS